MICKDFKFYVSPPPCLHCVVTFDYVYLNWLSLWQNNSFYILSYTKRQWEILYASPTSPLNLIRTLKETTVLMDLKHIMQSMNILQWLVILVAIWSVISICNNNCLKVVLKRRLTYRQANFHIMERLDQGHLHPLLEVTRLTCPGRKAHHDIRGGGRRAL
jgi:hypothetical protein